MKQQKPPSSSVLDRGHCVSKIERLRTEYVLACCMVKINFCTLKTHHNLDIVRILLGWQAALSFIIVNFSWVWRWACIFFYWSFHGTCINVICNPGRRPISFISKTVYFIHTRVHLLLCFAAVCWTWMLSLFGWMGPMLKCNYSPVPIKVSWNNHCNLWVYIYSAALLLNIMQLFSKWHCATCIYICRCVVHCLWILQNLCAFLYSLSTVLNLSWEVLYSFLSSQCIFCLIHLCPTDW